MKGTITEITRTLSQCVRKKRVAAYARVSCDKDTMLHSMAAQISHYHDYICGNPEWEFAGIFADEAKTGTKENRAQFQELLVKCREGEIDLILTKSISRFARNTVTVLNTVRELRGLGVEVYFEEENIKTLSAEGEVMITLLASFAQAESLSCSDNCKWRIRKGFEEGRSTPFHMNGYRLVNGEVVTVPEEAETVRQIFEMYLNGYGLQKICNKLNEDGRRTVNGAPWYHGTIRGILTNEKYIGNMLLQRTFTTDHLSKRRVKNKGELPQFYIEEDHEAVIDRDTFLTAQKRIEKQKRYEGYRSPYSVFSSKVRCGGCGKNYRRKVTSARTVWCCATFNTAGKKYCPTSKVIPEETLKEACKEVLGSSEFEPDMFSSAVEYIDALPENLLRFHFYNGTEAEYVWKDRSRSESWTSEMREAARQRAQRKGTEYGREESQKN